MVEYPLHDFRQLGFVELVGTELLAEERHGMYYHSYVYRVNI